MTKPLIDGFSRNAGYLRHRLSHLTHEESLAQVGGGANCVNWLVGHIVHYRHVVLETLDGGSSDLRFERYARESDPVLEDGDGVLPFADLLAELEASTEAASGALMAASEGRLAAPSDNPDRFPTVEDRIHFYLFHDTLHTGQADVVAALAKEES